MQFDEIVVLRDIAPAVLSSVAASARAFARAAAAHPASSAAPAASSVAASVRASARAAAVHPGASAAFPIGVVLNVQAVRAGLVVPVALAIVVHVDRYVLDVVARAAAAVPDVPAPALWSWVDASNPAVIGRFVLDLAVR